MIELMITAMILSIGIVSFMLALTSSMRLGRACHQKDVAVNAVRQMIERLREASFSSVFVRYNEDGSDDPGGAGTAPGPNFAVEDLKPVLGDTDGNVGKIIFPTSGNQLREDITDTDLGMPRDLNGDTTVDDQDHSGDYIILPVTVRVEWRGVAGNWSVEMKALLVYR